MASSEKASDASAGPSQSSNVSEVKKEKAPKMRGRREDTPEVRNSKTLSYILRHGAAKEGLKMRKDGFMRVDELLRRPKLKEVDLDTLKKLVENNDKKRYALAEEPNPDDPDGPMILWIRANQGHSLEVEDMKFETITTPEECPAVVHGTFQRYWPAIRDQGLKKMNRHHIHCASGLFGEAGVTSGMRASCDVYVYIDIERAMADDIVFEKSANGVILTKGKDGILAPKYFQKVETKKGERLWPESSNIPAS